MSLKAALQQREAERLRLLEEARAFARRVREQVGEARVYVYGSVVRGDFNLASDVDLLVVSPRLPSDPLERQRYLIRLAWGRLEPKGLLPEEYRQLEAKGGLAFLEGALEV